MTSSSSNDLRFPLRRLSVAAPGFCSTARCHSSGHLFLASPIRAYGPACFFKTKIQKYSRSQILEDCSQSKGKGILEIHSFFIRPCSERFHTRALARRFPFPIEGWRQSRKDPLSGPTDAEAHLCAYAPAPVKRGHLRFDDRPCYRYTGGFGWVSKLESKLCSYMY